MSESNVAARIEQAIKDYIQACNDGDAEKIAACFVSDAVHYFPTGREVVGSIHDRRQFLETRAARWVTRGQSI